MKKPRPSQSYLYFIATLFALSTYTAYAHHDEPHNASKTHEKPQAKSCKVTPLECAKTVTSTFDKKGVLWIGFVSEQTLYVQSSTDQGKTYSPAVKVNQIPEAIIAHDESRPQIKLDQQGHIYLTWSSQIQNAKERHSGNVRFSRSIDGGKTFSEPTTINDDNQAIGHGFDSLAIGKNGEIFITWLDGRDTAAATKVGEEFIGNSLYYSSSSDGGEHFSPNQQIAPHSCQCCRVQSEIDPTDNTPVVIWRQVFDGSIRDHALIKFNDWNTPGEITRISYENWKIDACPHHGAGFSIAKDGTYHAVWFSNSETQQGLFYGHSTDQGKTFSKSFNFAQQGAGHPHVLAIGKQVYIVWQQFDGKQTRIQLLKSKDAGQSWNKSETLASTEKNADQPFLVSDGKTAYLSWKVAQQGFHLQAVSDK